MPRAVFIAALAACWLSTPCAAQNDEGHHSLADMPPGLYKSDNEHTNIYFTYDHVGFSHSHARFDKFAGTLNYDPRHPEQSPVRFTIDPASVDTNTPELDRILKGRHFFNVARYPEIKFAGYRLRRLSPTNAVFEGDLTMHGVTRRISLDVRLNKFLVDSELKFCRFGFSATGKLKRSQWGFGDVPLVGDEINLTLEIEFLKAA